MNMNSQGMLQCEEYIAQTEKTQQGGLAPASATPKNVIA